jgi:hypothetical protein
VGVGQGLGKAKFNKIMTKDYARNNHFEVNSIGRNMDIDGSQKPKSESVEAKS